MRVISFEALGAMHVPQRQRQCTGAQLCGRMPSSTQVQQLRVHWPSQTAAHSPRARRNRACSSGTGARRLSNCAALHAGWPASAPQGCSRLPQGAHSRRHEHAISIEVHTQAVAQHTPARQRRRRSRRRQTAAQPLATAARPSLISQPAESGNALECRQCRAAASLAVPQPAGLSSKTSVRRQCSAAAEPQPAATPLAALPSMQRGAESLRRRCRVAAEPQSAAARLAALQRAQQASEKSLVDRPISAMDSTDELGVGTAPRCAPATRSCQTFRRCQALPCRLPSDILWGLAVPTALARKVCNLDCGPQHQVYSQGIACNLQPSSSVTYCDDASYYCALLVAQRLPLAAGFTQRFHML